MTRLTANRYRDLCAMVHDALDHPRPAIREVGSVCGWPIIVYMLGHRHPVTNAFIVDYVGSAFRSKSDASARIREHLKEVEKRKRFTCQVVMPLRLDLSVNEVRRIEGVVARALRVPRWCQRVPGGRGLHK